MQATIFVAVGGALGSVLRYWFSLWLAPISRDLPWSTIVVNIIGSFAIALFGALTVASSRFELPEIWRVAFLVGVCGGFTTFSSFSMQTVDLLRSGMPGRALLNVGISLAACFAATALGYVVAQALNKV
ncbi:fluoride efflux transporter CrcB [Ochrobactrum sp. Marseille-Q0166]|uniref:fluoride efflux transporter CrcB n=1 Tax=Ochrobactrum sp. Marseille-Q0166 TaxID=2761105 RepID=UPI0016555CA6|nr:fluoride efflux transporter CrcB [Ochrobactrum sp. Marseille-Q0166]MBC8717018.1 fluoride efflux transporter CrcB [Ochrobactrum sp. Marseille-Q0166]